MLKKLIISIILLSLLTGCRNASVMLWGPVMLPPKVTPIYKPMDILFTGTIPFPVKRTADFHRDSIVISTLIPPGWVVHGVTYTAFEGNVDSLSKCWDNKISFRIDSIAKATHRTQDQIGDSVGFALLLAALPPSGEAARAPEYDRFLTNLLDTGRTGRQFASFTGRLPINIPASKESTAVMIFGCIRVTPNTPGRFHLGFFMSLDEAGRWKEINDTTKDTVLSSFVDYDTITVTGEGITLTAQDAGNPSQQMLISSSNPMVQGGVISFQLPENARKSSVTLYDVSGRPIFTEPMTGQSGLKKYLMSRFTKRPLVAGQYVLRLTADGKSISRPITVIK